MSKKEAILREIEDLNNHMNQVKLSNYHRSDSTVILVTVEQHVTGKVLLKPDLLPQPIKETIDQYILNCLKRLAELQQMQVDLEPKLKEDTREFPCQSCDEGEYVQTGGGGPNGVFYYTCNHCGHECSFPL